MNAYGPDPGLTKRQSQIFLNKGNFDAGNRAALIALKADGKDGEAIKLFGAGAILAGEYNEGTKECLTRIEALPYPQKRLVHLFWAEQCIYHLQYGKAAALLRFYHDRLLDDQELAFLYIRSCLMAGEFAAGKPLADKYTEQWPEDAMGWALRARYYLEEGHKEICQQSALNTLARDPGITAALRTLGEIATLSIDDTLIARFSAEKKAPHLKPQHRRDIGFALGRAQEARQDWDQAFAEYTYANQALAELCRQENAFYDPEKIRQKFENNKKIHRFLKDNTNRQDWEEDGRPARYLSLACPARAPRLLNRSWPVILIFLVVVKF